MADLVLPFKLITPTGVLFDGPVAEVTAVNPIGEFGVLPQHINYITALVPCVVTVKLENGQYRLFVVSGGLVEVKDGVMTILALSTRVPRTLPKARPCTRMSWRPRNGCLTSASTNRPTKIRCGPCN